MKKFEYKVVNISVSPWLAKAKTDYLKVINEHGKEGWRFLQFAPSKVRPRGVKGIELLFERIVEE